MRNDVLWGVIAQNVRQPVAVMGDLQSQIASLGVGARAVEILTARYGADTLIASCSAMLDASEAAMRAAIGAIPDGSYEFEDFLDDDGIDVTRPVRIHARITVTGDRLVVDLSGSDREVPGPINATLGSTSSAVYFAIVAAAERLIVPNAGCYRPIEIVAPEGLIVSARHPAPVAHRLAPGHVLLNVLFGALAKAIPGRLPAAYYAVSYVCSFQTMEASGARKVLVEIEVGGCGAHPNGDGASAHSFGMHNNASIPVEMIESSMPITMVEYGLAPGTGGDGRHRGGLGLRRAWRIDSEAASFTGQMDRFRFRPFGLDGGEPGAAGQLELVRDGKAQALHSKISNMPLRKGDVIRLVTSGGGGLGPPAERQQSARRRDREQGYLK
jgi:N-methylhydantoinase B